MTKFLHRGACAYCLPSLLAFAALICFSTASFAQNGGTTVDISQWRFLQKAKLIGDAINKHDIDAIENEFDPIVQRDLPADTLKPLLWNMTNQLGTVEKMGEPKMKWKNVAIIPVKFQKGILDLQLALDSTDKISGFYFIPHKAEPPVPPRNATTFSLPFKGKWTVFWGGDAKEQNFYHDIKNQRFAMDVNISDELGKTHLGEGLQNQDFFAFGKEILAPADGIVTDAIDGVRDNPPFSGNEYSALGNAVVIQHGPSEYSVLSHLMRGSVRVHDGDTVKRGQVIGLCGNSGNSTEPNLHYFLVNIPLLQDATGIKMYFKNVAVQHKREEPHVEKEYSPMRNDKIESK
ncbi:MAG TPA: peptidoglycan DD-metalloendopeptidase family protein [Candidatus Kapabacteria bacterium]|nr:peptidoglycan DD-metalloendopeptidase family protein [Candidatus Kapabacteria bacterium]